MRVLLVHPHCLEARQVEENVAAPPIGLWWIAASLRAGGHEVRVYNAEVRRFRAPDLAADFAREVADFAPAVAGFSVLQANRFGALELARAAKSVRPGVVTVFGGPTPTFLWAHFLTHFPEVDVVAPGEGEAAMVELCAVLERGGGPAALAGTPGLALRGPEGPVRTAPRPPIADLDALPLPAEFATYQHLSLTRGCPGSCRFCGSPLFWGPKVRFRSPQRFVDEMELLARRGARFLYVSDDTFTLRREAVLEVCAGIQERGLGLTWAAISRVDRVDAEVLSAMRRAGCVQLSFGVESGSARIRRNLGKGTTDADIRRAFELTRRAGILPRAYFIYGSPGEDDASIAETVERMAEIKPLMALFHVLVILPGTRLWDEYAARTGATDDVWCDPIEDIMYFETDPAIAPEAMRAWKARLHGAFEAGLPGWARELAEPGALDPDPALAPCHADFLSRLGLTFLEGDYAALGEPAMRADLAGTLFDAALGYGEHPRAWLGRGILRQMERDADGAAEAFERGLGLDRDNASLRLGLAVARMNQGRFAEALTALEPLGPAPEAEALRAHCRAAGRADG
ncbi:MAG: radical SAM protein [Desulfovibrionaceae bacterium]